MNRLFVTLCFLLVVFTLSNVHAQGNLPPGAEEQARAELAKRGLNENDVRERLRARGFDPDNIQPEQAAEVQQALEEIVKELEAENKEKVVESTTEVLEQQTEKAQKEIAQETGAEVIEAVKEGATVEEAVAEELIDQASEEVPPPAIYGQQIFRDKSIRTYRKSADIKPPDSYVLGVGDKVSISIWGRTLYDKTHEITEGGFIQPQNMSRINLKGIALGKARDLLRSRFAQYYPFSNGEFEVTVAYSRTITVNIYGDVFNPGGFIMPATNTAFNALVAAGGPSDIGSVREIYLYRGGQQPRKIDVYEFMMTPSVQDKLYLLDNDIIHVGPAKRVISIQGAVKRPFRYELIEGEQLKKLIEYAGGLQNNAYKGNIQIKRFENDQEKLIDVNLEALLKSNQDFNLLPGDQVVIRSIARPYKNFVEVSGAVDLPGRYELTAGMKVSDLLAKGVLNEQSKTDIAFLLRTNNDGTIRYLDILPQAALDNPADGVNLTLEPQDRLIIFNKARFTDAATLSINGAVREPGEQAYDASRQLRVSDLINLAGGLKPEATDFAYIQRLNLENRKEKEYIRVDLSQAVNQPGTDADLLLEPFDALTVYSTLTYTDETFVTVAGAVRNAGQFKYDASLSLADVLTMAGGLQLQAASNRIDIFRVEINQNEPTKTIAARITVDENFQPDQEFTLQPFDQIVVRTTPEFELQEAITIKGEVDYPGSYALVDDNEKLWSVLQRAGGLTKEAFLEGATLYREEEGTGYVILKLDEVKSNQSSPYNYILKKGDVITIPKQKDLVTIRTANTDASEILSSRVTNTGKLNVAYEKGKRANYYVNGYAAGVGEKGRRRLISVEHPNGEVQQTKNFIFFKSYPKVRAGSIVSVGRKKEKEKKQRGDKKDKESYDWGKTIANGIAQATGVLSLILLIQQVNR